jgi:hypothetical protein
MAESKEVVQYDKAELRAITGAFKAMDDEAIAQAKEQSSALADYLKGKISSAAGSLNSASVAGRIAEGSKVSKSSKIGEISFGFAGQKFSGGATTRDLWGGSEFGSNKYKQFPIWSGSTGRGSTGYFIYPTLRAEQSYLIAEWEKAFTSIVKRFD